MFIVKLRTTMRKLMLRRVKGMAHAYKRHSIGDLKLAGALFKNWKEEQRQLELESLIPRFNAEAAEERRLKRSREDEDQEQLQMIEDRWVSQEMDYDFVLSGLDHTMFDPVFTDWCSTCGIWNCQCPRNWYCD